MTDGDAPGGDGRGAASRKRILETALLLFSEQGYRETSVAELAGSADVSKGLVYHYFDTKRDVLSAVMARGADRLQGTLDRPELRDSPAALVMEVLGLVAEDLPWWRLFFRLRAGGGVGREPSVASWDRSLERSLEKSFRSSGAEEPRRRAGALVAAVEGAAQRYVLDPDGYPLVEVAETIVAVHLSTP